MVLSRYVSSVATERGSVTPRMPEYPDAVNSRNHLVPDESAAGPRPRSPTIVLSRYVSSVVQSLTPETSPRRQQEKRGVREGIQRRPAAGRPRNQVPLVYHHFPEIKPFQMGDDEINGINNRADRLGVMRGHQAQM